MTVIVAGLMAILALIAPHKAHSAPQRASRGAQRTPAKLGVSPPNPSPNWDRLAQCESTGRWQANTGNGYYGGLQFSAHTWHANGGDGLPHEHTRDEQIAVATLLYQRSGRRPWPYCGRFL